MVSRKRCNSLRSRHDDPPEPADNALPPASRREGTPNKEAALNAFIGRKAEIDEMLARLQSLSADHFNAYPDEVNWGHVGTLSITPPPEAHHRQRL